MYDVLVHVEIFQVFDSLNYKLPSSKTTTDFLQPLRAWAEYAVHTAVLSLPTAITKPGNIIGSAALPRLRLGSAISDPSSPRSRAVSQKGSKRRVTTKQNNTTEGHT